MGLIRPRDMSGLLFSPETAVGWGLFLSADGLSCVLPGRCVGGCWAVRGQIKATNEVNRMKNLHRISTHERWMYYAATVAGQREERVRTVYVWLELYVRYFPPWYLNYAHTPGIITVLLSVF